MLLMDSTFREKDKKTLAVANRLGHIQQDPVEAANWPVHGITLLIVSQSRACTCLLETFRVKHHIETMEVAVVYSKSAKVSRKVSASEVPEHRTAPSLRCVGLKVKLSKGLKIRSCFIHTQ